MDQNDILSNKLLKNINKIEKREAEIRAQKETALIEIRKQIPKTTFVSIILSPWYIIWKIIT